MEKVRVRTQGLERIGFSGSKRTAQRGMRQVTWSLTLSDRVLDGPHGNEVEARFGGPGDAGEPRVVEAEVVAEVLAHLEALELYPGMFVPSPGVTPVLVTLSYDDGEEVRMGCDLHGEFLRLDGGEVSYWENLWPSSGRLGF